MYPGGGCRLLGTSAAHGSVSRIYTESSRNPCDSGPWCLALRTPHHAQQGVVAGTMRSTHHYRPSSTSNHLSLIIRSLGEALPVVFILGVSGVLLLLLLHCHQQAGVKTSPAKAKQSRGATRRRAGQEGSPPRRHQSTISSCSSSSCGSGVLSENNGLVGLRNIGNTCFMNSVTQCLSNTRCLLEYLVRDGYSSDINTTISTMKGDLIRAFANLLSDMWNEGGDNSRALNTGPFKSQIQSFAPVFSGYQQHDAQEFLRKLLEGLHEDVNRVTAKPKPITEDIDEDLDDNQKAMESWKRYLRYDDSKIVDMFVGQLKSCLQCSVCGHCSVTFDPFWDLSLPIPSKSGQVRLAQCLDLFTKEEVLDGDERPTCSKCKERRKMTKTFSIQKFPKVFVLHLKRFSPLERWRGKLSCTVEFPLEGLNLSKYASSSSASPFYNLSGVANHSGTTYSGHYTAYCKHPYSGTWHEYNDSRVSNISPGRVCSPEAYVLFYELSSASSKL